MTVNNYAFCPRILNFLGGRLLSPPVLMHGGLLCIAFRLSVCLSVCLHTETLEVKGHTDQGQIRVPNKGRWAHDNIKMPHFCLGSITSL